MMKSGKYSVKSGRYSKGTTKKRGLGARISANSMSANTGTWNLEDQVVVKISGSFGKGGKIIMCGYLKKKNPGGISRLRTWKTRYFELTTSRFDYFLLHSKEHQMGSIDLSKVLRVVHHEKKKGGCRFDVVTMF